MMTLEQFKFSINAALDASNGTARTTAHAGAIQVLASAIMGLLQQRESSATPELDPVVKYFLNRATDTHDAKVALQWTQAAMNAWVIGTPENSTT